jgi:hypothetical protein
MTYGHEIPLIVSTMIDEQAKSRPDFSAYKEPR